MFVDGAKPVYDELMGGGPDHDPDRTPPVPPVERDVEVPISERETTVPPPPSVDPAALDLAATREIQAMELPADAFVEGETTEVPHLASQPVKITKVPEATLSNRPTVRPAEAQAAESGDADPFAEDWEKP